MASATGKLQFPVVKRDSTASAKAGKTVTESKVAGVVGGFTKTPASAVPPPSADRVSPADGVQQGPYMMPFLWAAVGYEQEGHETNPNVLKVYHYVKANYVIPVDFQTSKYGPLNGTTFEARVVHAYMHGQLEAAPLAAAPGLQMCMDCGNAGHFPRYCPEAF